MGGCWVGWMASSMDGEDRPVSVRHFQNFMLKLPKATTPRTRQIQLWFTSRKLDKRLLPSWNVPRDLRR